MARQGCQRPGLSFSVGMTRAEREAGYRVPYPRRPAQFTPGRASTLFTEIPTWPAEATEFAISGPQTWKSKLNTALQALRLPVASLISPIPSGNSAAALPPTQAQPSRCLGHPPPHCCLLKSSLKQHVPRRSEFHSPSSAAPPPCHLHTSG